MSRGPSLERTFGLGAYTLGMLLIFLSATGMIVSGWSVVGGLLLGAGAIGLLAA